MADIFLYKKQSVAFQPMLKLLKSSIKILCKKAINSNYIDLKDNDYSHIIVAFSKGSERSKKTPTTVLGFILLTELDDETIEITLICAGNNFREKASKDAQGLSKKLFESVYDVCEKENYNIIQLTALPYVINYYRKLGFRHILDPNCNGKDREKTEIKHLAEYFAKKKFKSDDELMIYMKIDKEIQLHISLDKKKKVITDESKLLDKINELIDEETSNNEEKQQYMKYYKKSKRTFGENKIITFFEKLIEHGFSSECDALKNVFRTTNWLDDDKPQCVGEGFIMTKCLNIQETKKRSKCPNGTRKNKISGKCEKKSQKLRRCPNGSRKNKISGKCEKTSN